MKRADVIFLIGQEFQQDSIGQTISVETQRRVFCDISSISQSEFFEAGRIGLKPAFQVTMFSHDYQDETECVLHGTRYTIYRHYYRNSDVLELYLEKRVGS